MYLINGKKPTVADFLRHEYNIIPKQKKMPRWTLYEVKLVKELIKKNLTNKQIHKYLPYKSFIAVKNKVLRLKKQLK